FRRVLFRSPYWPGVASIGPIGRSPPAQVVHVQDDRAADAADGQDAGYLIVTGTDAFATSALEGDGGVLRDVKEVTTAQMVIALRFAGPQLVGLNGRLDGQIHGITGVEL